MARNWNNTHFDWNHIRAFLAAAEEGSLSAAARALGQTQPTLSRQISAIEASLGIILFERGHRQLQLTAAGLELLDYARIMLEAADRISWAASGQSQDIEGEVCITATEMHATYCLPQVVKTLRKQAPGLIVKIVASDKVSDLMQREADIAIRHVRPEQPELIAKKIGAVTAHIYASKQFLAEREAPTSLDDLKHYDLVGVDDIEWLLEGLAQQGLQLSLEQFKTKSPSGNCMLQLIREGLGLGFLPADTARLFEDLVPILQDYFKPEVPIWLVTHRELHTSRRIRLVFDVLVEQLNIFSKIA